MVDQLLVDADFEVEPLLADDPAGGVGVGVVDFEVDLGHLVLGVPLVAEAEHPVPVGAGDAPEGVAAEAELLLVVARGGEQEPRVALDLLVVPELDDEVAVAVAEVFQAVFFEEGLDHGVAEAVDESHALSLRGGRVTNLSPL